LAEIASSGASHGRDAVYCGDPFLLGIDADVNVTPAGQLFAAGQTKPVDYPTRPGRRRGRRVDRQRVGGQGDRFDADSAGCRAQVRPRSVQLVTELGEVAGRSGAGLDLLALQLGGQVDVVLCCLQHGSADSFHLPACGVDQQELLFNPHSAPGRRHIIGAPPGVSKSVQSGTARHEHARCCRDRSDDASCRLVLIG